MGNHEIDCDFCGKDQRLVGSRCCEESRRHLDIKRENRAAKREELALFIKQIDPDVYIASNSFSDKMNLEDVVKLIKKAVAQAKETK